MPDLSLRFHKDVLVLSSSAASAFERLGIDIARDVELTILLEPETVEEVYKLECVAGAQCLVAPTWGITPARLAHAGMQDRAADLAKIALSCVRTLVPQHLLVEIGPCGLPLDPSSKASLNENRDQYARAARLFAHEEFDAFLLGGFVSCDDLKCALMGVRKVSDAPVMASVVLDAEGFLSDGRSTWEDALAVMAEYGATAAGFETEAGQEAACALARRGVAASSLPLMATLRVRERSARQQGPTEENPYYCADAMMAAADALRRCGVQFLRATGDATPAYTGALVATTLGSDVLLLDRAVDLKRDAEEGKAQAEAALPNKDADLEAFIAAAKARVDAALAGNVALFED